MTNDQFVLLKEDHEISILGVRQKLLQKEKKIIIII